MRHKLVRNGRWVGPGRHKTQNLLVEYWVEENMPGDYATWLVKNLGRPMERALIRARQRHEAQKRRHLMGIRASRILYRRKRR